MKIAIIPARGGSKRIPRKNIKLFAGIPMIAYAIRAARSSALFDRILISTDDDEIAAIAEELGAEAPFRRPPELANDFAGTTEVIQHALRWTLAQGWNPKAACCIYATVPLLQAQHLIDAWDLLCAKRKSFCFPVARFPSPIQRALMLTEDGVEMFDPTSFSKRSQDLTAAYHDAGQFYWGTTSAWLDGEILFSHNAVGMVLPRHLVQDIDTPEDWEHAERLFAFLHKT